jgi:predicted NAD-dependent protein-ADP-ribosyltransferase YbiA (DUF1768 family)
MHTGCQAKFQQNPDLMRLLNDTGSRTIVEARSDDNFWELVSGSMTND